MLSPVKKTGKVEVTLTYTDQNGVSVTSDPKEIEVVESAVSINFTNEYGVVTDVRREICADISNDSIVYSSLYVTFTDKESGDYINWGPQDKVNIYSVEESNGQLLYDAKLYSQGEEGKIFRLISYRVNPDLGSETFRIVCEVGGKTYTREVTVYNYHTLKFAADDAQMVDGCRYTLTLEDKAAVKVSGVGGAADGNSYTVKIYVDDLEEDGSYVLDLSPYTVSYTGSAAIEFAGWTYKGSNGFENIIPEIRSDSVSYVGYSIVPAFMDASPKAITVGGDVEKDGSILIDNSEKKNYRQVSVNVSPETAAVISADTDIVLDDEIDGYFCLDNGIVTSGKNDKAPIKLDGATQTGDGLEYHFTVSAKSRKVGDKATIKLSVYGDDETVRPVEIPVKIYGQYEDKKGIRYAGVDGEDAVDTSVTVDDVERFYDENGYMIVLTDIYSPAHDADGNMVLLKPGQSGDKHAEKVTGTAEIIVVNVGKYMVIDGNLMAGTLFEFDGHRYYANTEGLVVTYGVTEELGTPGSYTDPVTGITYVINEDGTAEEDKLFVVDTVEWNWEKTGFGYQNATVTFTSTDNRTKVLTVSKNEIDKTRLKWMEITGHDGYTEYKAYASFLTLGKLVEATETKCLDEGGYEVFPHEGDHEWKDYWTWAENYSSAKAELICTKGADPETRVVEVKDIVVTTNGNLTVYTASVKYDNNTFTSSKAVSKNGGQDAIVDNSTGLIVSGLEDDFVYDGTKKTFSNLKVYWNDSILVEGTDYKLTYANNINAGDETASVTITGMGQYEKNVSEVISFSIEKADFADCVTPKDEKWTTSLLVGTKVTAPAMLFNGKTLNKKLYTVTLEDDADIVIGQKAAKAGEWTATVAPSAEAAANFEGSVEIAFRVFDKENTVTADKVAVTTTVSPIGKKSDFQIDPAVAAFTLKYKNVTLSESDFDEMFEVSEDEFYSAGTRYVTLTALDGAKIGAYNIVGSKRIKVTVKGLKLSSMKNSFAVLDKKSVPYKGEAWDYDDVLEELGLEDDAVAGLVRGTDYTVETRNNLKKGTMKVVFTGTGIYEGTVTKNVPIRALTEDEYTIVINGETYEKGADELIEVPYTAGGTVIENLKVTAFDGFLLREGVDYTVSYKDNKTVGQIATLTINGKKNYGKGVVQFKVCKNETCSVYTLPYEVTSPDKADGKKAPVIYDAVSGKKLTVGKDFTYKYDTDLRSGVLFVHITNGTLGTYDFGDGMDLHGYHVFATAVSNKFVSVKGTHYYTGSAVTLSASDFSGLKLGEDFVIVGYKNNIKAGTAKVTIRGIGTYGKTCTLSFKINKATVKGSN